LTGGRVGDTYRSFSQLSDADGGDSAGDFSYGLLVSLLTKYEVAAGKYYQQNPNRQIGVILDVRGHFVCPGFL
jgi:hypothetical protein